MPKLALTLDAVMNDLRKAQHFYRFAKHLACAENLDFLYACRQLNVALGTAVFRPVPNNLMTQGAAAAAQYIYDRFVLASGTHPNRIQININSTTRAALDTAATQGTLGTATFNQAYQAIWNVVVHDTWKKFSTPGNDHLNLARQYWDNNDLRGYVQG